MWCLASPYLKRCRLRGKLAHMSARNVHHVNDTVLRVKIATRTKGKQARHHARLLLCVYTPGTGEFSAISIFILKRVDISIRYLLEY